MKSALLTVILMTALASATQIVYMDLDEVLPMAGSVLIAGVVSMEAFEGDGWKQGPGTNFSSAPVILSSYCWNPVVQMLPAVIHC